MNNGSFIERHGFVKYAGRLSRRYPRVGECEVGACRLMRQQEAAMRAEWRAEFAGMLAALPNSRAQLLTEWLPEAKRRIARDRRPNDAALYRLGFTREQVGMAYRVATEDQAEAWERERAERPLVFDHCHVHGWIRGLVCHECNMQLSAADAGRLTADDSSWAPLVLAYRGNCPDCWRFDVRRLR